MSLSFLEVINAIEAEISAEYLPNAIQWADEKFDGEWSKAIDRFERALVLTQERMDYNSIKIEAEVYKRCVLDLLAKYKQEQKLSCVQSFLESLATQKKTTIVT